MQKSQLKKDLISIFKTSTKSYDQLRISTQKTALINCLLCSHLRWDYVKWHLAWQALCWSSDSVRESSSWKFKMDEFSVFRLSYMYPAACLLAATLWLGLFEGDLRVAKRPCSVCMKLFLAFKKGGSEITTWKQQFRFPIHNLV